MRDRLAKAYDTNPILFIHGVAVIGGIVMGMVIEAIRLIANSEPIPEAIREFIMVAYLCAMAFWLGTASAKRCKMHMHDESKITYIGLLLYSRIVNIATIVWSISYVITVLTRLF